jgi:hypothetical protein
MEDDLKIFKVKYLSNYLFDPPQLLNLSLGDLDKLKKKRRLHMEEDLKISKVDYKIFLKLIGNRRGNLKCGSAQPSLLLTDYCHTRPYLGVEAHLKFLQIPACKIGPQSGIITWLVQPPTHPPGHLD